MSNWMNEAYSNDQKLLIHSGDGSDGLGGRRMDEKWWEQWEERERDVGNGGCDGGGVVHFHAQSVKDSPMMTIMSVNTEMRGEERRCSFIMADANMVEQISCTKFIELSWLKLQLWVSKSESIE